MTLQLNNNLTSHLTSMPNAIKAHLTVFQKRRWVVSVQNKINVVPTVLLQT